MSIASAGRGPAAPQAGRRLGEEVLEAPVTQHLHDVSVIERDRAPADAADQLAIVRGDEHRRAAGVDLAEQVHDLERQVRIEVAGRLVGQDDRGSLTSARAMATRCCSPPDSSIG